mgnify:CR=1 FL=1
MAARSFLGAGDIFVDRQIDGISVGLIGPYKANKFEISPKVSSVESTSKGRYDFGQVLETVNLPQPTEFTLELKEITGDVLVMAFLGTSAALNQVSGTLTNQLVAVSKKGTWLEIGKKNLAATGIVVKNEAGVTTYVEGVDYELNRPMGWIRILAASAIAVAANVSISGGYRAATGSVISGSTRTEIRARLVFDGINQADGTQCTVDVREAVLSADSAFDFLADDFGNVTLTGKLKTPVGKAEPYTVTVQDPVV